MSHFSSVDSSPDPHALVRSLDASATGLASMKAYMAAAAARAVPGGLVLDLGCGAGHDLALLADQGMRAIGLDPSWTMVTEARDRLDGRGVPILHATGAALPFADFSLDGCRIERVLQHVDDPIAVMDEVARATRPSGFLAVFEPDWTSWRFDTDVPGAEVIGPMLGEPRHPDIGARLATIVENCGFRLVDEVTEASIVSRLDRVPISVEGNIERLTAAGRVEGRIGRDWLAEQRARDAAGTFRLRQSKVLVVAERR